MIVYAIYIKSVTVRYLLNKVSEKEEGVMALHLPIGPSEPVPRCEPSTHQPISQWQSHCTIWASVENIRLFLFYWYLSWPLTFISLLAQMFQQLIG